MNFLIRTLLIALSYSVLSVFTPAFGVEDDTDEAFAKSIVVDLRDPCYSEGVVTTEHGGVITGPDIRIQATHIEYIKKPDVPVYSIVAEGDLMMEFGKYIFIGERLEYDFLTRTGKIYNGRTMAEPWYFGGALILLCANGDYILHHGFLTTSMNYDPEWELASAEATLTCDKDLSAKNVQLRLFKVPILWLPGFKTNIDDIFDSPIKYNIRLWGRQGPRIGATYELLAWNRWKTFLRLDYRLNRGPGGGFETRYLSEDHKTSFHTINYVAMDSSLIHPNERVRYRFQGVYDTLMMNDRVSVDLSWDKLSDKDMATDYKDKGLELDTAGRTQLLVRRQEERWITNFITRVRLNKFQSLKQELPTIESTWHPFELGRTGIISDPLARLSYLDFVYGNNLMHVHNYSAPRLEFAPQFYRHFQLRNMNFTPEMGAVGIFYGNSPHGDAKWLALGTMGFVVDTNLTRIYKNCKHVVTPYTKYDYYTYPTVSPNDHYIFDIEDGWYRLNMCRFGVAQSLYCKNSCGLAERKIFVDVWGNAFFGTQTIHAVVPKVYATIVFNTLSYLRYIFNSAWDFSRNELDHFNVRLEWTVNQNMAIATEYRHRDAYDWRKADHTNFILDSFRSISQLRHSQLSDRRDTILTHFFFRFHPNWAVEFQSRQGWNRIFEPNYLEFEIDLLAALRSSLNVRLAYQHKENDDRIGVYFNIGAKRPDIFKECNIVPFLYF